MMRPQTSRIASLARRSLVSAAAPAHAAPGATPGAAPRASPRRWGYALAGGLVLAGSAYALRPARLDAEEQSRPGIRGVPTSSLVRSYFVYALCGIPALIDASPTILHALTHSPVPGLKAATEAVVRRTFFAQFVAGEDAPECISVINQMQANGVGGVLNYSAEAELGDGKAAAHREAEAHNLVEVNAAIDALGEYERHLAATGGTPGASSFAVKVSGLVDPTVLERASTTLVRTRPLTSKLPDATLSDAVPFPGVPQPSDALVMEPSGKAIPVAEGAAQPLGLLASDQGVSEADIVVLKDLWNKLYDMSVRARDNGVKLMIDAEHAETQPALDALTLLLSREFNRPVPGEEFKGPIIFGTYQSYLRRAPALLSSQLADAEQNGYALGIKLVRGAYYLAERKKWKDEHRSGPDPIWPDKKATDKAYDSSLSIIASTLARQLSSSHPELALSVVFATHNAESVKLAVDALEANGLAEPVPVPEGAVGAPHLHLRPDVRGKVFVAQLYGMRDDLTDRVAQTFDSGAMPVALKYIAYGKLDEVIPFLGRRAIENKSVMSGEGGAGAERARVSAELWRRVTGGK
ncbi:proline dehydrogenase [Vanrija albida]|uniref:Proline dehydrogenase n=1 Tax=Vanrija albida TaxID=181172 RepID=A0ABR3Q2E4_9TREE